MAILSKKLFRQLATPQNISKWDKLAFDDYSIPTVLLMENAAREVFYALKEAGYLLYGQRIIIFAGAGNNGGDGIALARILHEKGYAVHVLTMTSQGKYKNVAAKHLKMAKLSGVSFSKVILRQTAEGLSEISLPKAISHSQAQISSLRDTVPCFKNSEGASSIERGETYSNSYAQITHPFLIVDALFGAGFKGPLRDEAVNLIEAINRDFIESKVVAIDIPSGLDSLSGRPAPVVIKADFTISLAAEKVGTFLPWAKGYTGPVKVCDISIPAKLYHDYPADFLAIAPSNDALTAPDSFVNKSDKGKVMILGGSQGLTGAPSLSAIGALRSGAGLVTILSPAGLCNEIRSGFPEFMTHPLRGSDSLSASSPILWNKEMFDEIEMFIESLRSRTHETDHSAIVIGPGMGRQKETLHIIKRILELEQRPSVILDADGLYFLRLYDQENDHDYIRAELLKESDVITPHPGEMQRILFGNQSRPMYQDGFDDQEARLYAVDEFRSNCKATILLKGAGTLVAQQGKRVAVSNFANSLLAVAGSGDVLAGAIGALLAKGLPAFEATCLGSFLHGLAGELISDEYPFGGGYASEIADKIPDALKKVSIRK